MIKVLFIAALFVLSVIYLLWYLFWRFLLWLLGSGKGRPRL